MYQNIDGHLVISVNDWERAGLTYYQFNHDAKDGLLEIYRRGINGNTLIDVRSIKRPERLAVLERAYGNVKEKAATSIFTVELDTKARSFYVSFTKPDGEPLSDDQILRYTNRASIFLGLKKGLEIQRAARAKAGKRVLMGEFWKLAAKWYMEQVEEWPCDPLSNARRLSEEFKKYVKDGYGSIIHGNTGNDSARVVSASAARLIPAIWRMNDKPFIARVHELYHEFVAGDREFFDRESGEVFIPADFRHKGRALEVSEATIWNYLKDVVNETAIYSDRNGNFNYVNTKRPKHRRKMGRFSLSKISMDDVALSRKSVGGKWVYKYIAVDVVSGYWFRPAYVVGKPNHDTVLESFRNMFCELIELDLPMPGELEVEFHLMKELEPILNEMFPFVRFCSSPTEKRAEHKIKEFKYGASKKAGHTRGRWYAKHEAYRTVRNKMSGDMVEPEYQPQSIVADDLADIETHNDELHPLQKTYPGMTRREVFLSRVNPDLEPIEKWHLYKFIGNETSTSIYNNDFVKLQQMDFELSNYDSLKRLKPNNYQVTAYWLPTDDGSIKEAYIYQDGRYIDKVTNATDMAYNENKIEQTQEDYDKMLHQQKRISKFDKFIKEEKTEIPNIGSMDTVETASFADVKVELVETVQPGGYEEDEFTFADIDWEAMGRESM